MANKLTVKFFRAEIVRKKLEALPDHVVEGVLRALSQSADDVVKTAKALVPVSAHGSRGNPAGTLRDSITWVWGDAALVRKDGKKSSGYGLAGVIKTGSNRNQPSFKVSVGASSEYLKAHKVPIQLPRWIEFGTQPQKKGEKVVNLDRRGRVTRVRRARGDHAGNPPRPYLFPAFRLHQKTIAARLRTAVNAALNALSKKK